MPSVLRHSLEGREIKKKVMISIHRNDIVMHLLIDTGDSNFCIFIAERVDWGERYHIHNVLLYSQLHLNTVIVLFCS